jgi:dTDP-4-dehydrorhamnose 3,5-epimerase
VIFRPTALPGVIAIEPEKLLDERGHFARTYSQREFSANGIEADFVINATSYNRRAGTLRGLHFQAPPAAESKLVSCIQGRAFDVIVDLRRNSLSYGRWISIELSPECGTLVFIPEGCAHGFQTLAPNTVLHYQLSAEQREDRARGVRWDDPALAVTWPYPEPTVLSPRDAALPWLDRARMARIA